jgi:hypothetical protein
MTNFFASWVTKTTSNKSLIYFRMAFAGIWLIYDLIDIWTSATLKIIWFYHLPVPANLVFGLQILLITFEIGLLLGWYPRTLAFGAFLARAYFASFFTLNDFFYFSIAALLLSVSDSSGSVKEPKQVLAWPRDLFILQTGWIYFASAFLKLNPAFLSGSDLLVRNRYAISVLPIYYPEFYRSLVSSLSGNSFLSWCAVIMEMSLALSLFSWLLFPAQRKKLHYLALALAIGIHVYAAYGLNVFFFGASMIAQVGFLSKE